jgi:hypothetical protein
MSDTAPATGKTISEAANDFAALLSGPTDTENPDNQEALENPTDQVDAEESDAQETPKPEGEEGAEEEAPADDSEESEETAEAPATVTVKVDGKTEELPLEEVVKGYQRQADYSRKTADLAEQRKAHEADKAAVATERAQYAQLLTALSTQLQGEVEQEPDWQKLYDADPLDYVRQRDIFRDKQERLAAARAEQHRVNGLQTKAFEEDLKGRVAEGRSKLLEAVPSWKDSKKWEADRAKLIEYGKSIGFTEQELGNTYDHRAVLALHKARQFDDLLKSKPVPNKSAGPKSLAAGTVPSPAPSKNTKLATQARQRLASTGRVADAAAVFEGLL